MNCQFTKLASVCRKVFAACERNLASWFQNSYYSHISSHPIHLLLCSHIQDKMEHVLIRMRDLKLVNQIHMSSFFQLDDLTMNCDDFKYRLLM